MMIPPDIQDAVPDLRTGMASLEGLHARQLGTAVTPEVLSGTLAILPETEGSDHVGRLSAEFEERLRPKKPWTADKMDAHRRSAMMKAIVTMELTVPLAGIEAQYKLVQHKGAVEHRGAIKGLRARGDASSAAVADMIERALASRGD